MGHHRPRAGPLLPNGQRLGLAGAISPGRPVRCPGFGHTVREPQVALEAVARASPPLSTVTLGVKVSLNRPGRRGDEGGEQRAGVPGCRSTPRGPRSGSIHCGAPPSARGHVSFSAHARAALHGQGPCWSSKRLPDRPPAFLLHILWEWRPRDSGTCRQQQPGPRAQTWGQHVPAEARGRWRASGLVPWAGGGRTGPAPPRPSWLSRHTPAHTRS